MYKLSAIELRDQFFRGDVKAVDIIDYYLKRINALDKDVGAFLNLFHDQALKQAEALDKKKASGARLGKLAGIPIALKDNILVKDEIATCGSKFLTNFRSPYNASIVEMVLEEDGIIIGKTNMDEFAMGSSTENSALQKTRNPWNLKWVPGGSSGGSGAAVAARFAPIALGSDTGGSVRLPAAFCGVVGYKPTYGRVSRYGLVAYGSSMDQIGILATNTADVALMMEVIGRHCPKDSTSLHEECQDFLTHFKDSIKGMKLGVPWKFLEDLTDEPKSNFLNSIEILKMLGAEIVEIDLGILKYSVAVYNILASAEASSNLARFDGIRYGQRSERAKTLDEIYDFSKEEGFGPEVKRRIMLGTYVLSAGNRDAYYKKGQKVRTLISRAYKEAFSKCDLIAMPVSPFAAFEIGAVKGRLQIYMEDIYTIGVNLAGLPAVSIPNGLTKDGKPLGLQLIGPQKHDRNLLVAANVIEKGHTFKRAIPTLADKQFSP